MFNPIAGLSKPPLENIQEETQPGIEQPGGQPAAEAPKGGKEPIPLSVDFVEITLGSVGTIAFQLTGYSPFQFTQKELQTIANLAAACEMKAPAQIQLIIGLVTLVGAKVGGYVMWKRAGKPPVFVDPETGEMVVGRKDEPPAAAGAPVK